MTTRKKKSRQRKFFLVLAAMFCMVIVGWIVGQIYPVFTKEVSHIMILGVDRRDGDTGRSDTLIVATVIEPEDDRTEKPKVSLLWIPRDTLADIPKHGEEKIAHAFAYGGPQLSAEVVGSLLNVKIDHYILIEKKVFQRVIDTIGGVDIDVEKRMYYVDPWDDDGGLYIDLFPGMQHLNGDESIQYVRYRDSEGDIGRIRRQRHFIEATMDRVLSPEVIPKLPYAIREIYNSIETDLSLGEILQLASTVQNAEGMKTESVPGEPAYIDGVSYWEPDEKKLDAIMKEFSNVKKVRSEGTSARH